MNFESLSQSEKLTHLNFHLLDWYAHNRYSESRVLWLLATFIWNQTWNWTKRSINQFQIWKKSLTLIWSMFRVFWGKIMIHEIGGFQTLFRRKIIEKLNYRGLGCQSRLQRWRCRFIRWCRLMYINISKNAQNRYIINSIGTKITKSLSSKGIFGYVA